MNDDELLRYSRHIMLQGLDIDGQARLRSSRALVVGLGGLGAPAAMYLAAGGIGELRLADHDHVELSNLQRQIIHGTGDIGRSKTASATERLAELNPEVRCIAVDERLDEHNLREQVAAVDVVLDGSDNFATRYAVNAACVAERRPLISGAVIRMEAQLAVFRADSPDAPCYRCLYPEAAAGQEETCSETGVLAPLPGVIGSLQAVEAIKLLTGLGRTMDSRLLVLDALEMRWHSLNLRKDPTCPVCHAC